MTRLIGFFAFLLFSIIPSLANEEVVLSQGRIDDKITQLQRQYDNLQKYIFNLQGIKDKPHAKTTLNTDQFAEQIKLLRREVEELKKEMDKLKASIANYSSDLEKKIIKLRNQIDEKSYDKKILDIIDTNLNTYHTLEDNVSNQKEQFIDSMKLQGEEKEYDKIIDLINHENYEQATRELKKFVVEHPNSILISNAFFYLGEIAFKQKNYTSAAVNYFRGYQVDRNGERSMSNLVMLSKSMVQIGKYATACKVIQHIEYSFSDIPALMKRNIKNIKNSAYCNS